MRRMILVGLMVILVQLVVGAQSISEFWGGAYPQVQESGPAVAAMGGAGVALPGDIGAALLNPATLASTKAPKGWNLALDATLAESVFHQDAWSARKAYIGISGKLLRETIIGSTNGKNSLYLGYNALTYTSDRWAVGLVANRSVAYRVPFQKDSISITWLRPVWSSQWYSSPMKGQGNIQESQYALLAAFRPTDFLSLGIGVSCINSNVNLSTVFFDPDFTNVAVGSESTRSSVYRLVPLAGLLWHGNHWSLGLSYEGGFSSPMTVERVYLIYKKMVGEYRHPPRASAGLAYTSQNFQAAIQVDRLWSQLHTDHMSPYYPAAWFRTDNGLAYRFGMKFSGLKGFGEAELMVGIAYTRNNGLYLKPGTFDNIPKSAQPYYSAYLGYYLSLTYPKHEPLTTMSCGALIKLSKNVSLIPEIQASTYSKAARLGVTVNF